MFHLSRSKLLTLNFVLGSRRHHEPHIPSSSLTSLVSALKIAHQRLITPPEHLRDNPEKLARWKPRVRETIDWEAVLRSRGDGVYGESVVPDALVDDAGGDEMFSEEDSDESYGPRLASAAPIEPVHSPLTIGLIGTLFHI